MNNLTERQIQVGYIKQRQSMDLDSKIQMSLIRIKDFYDRLNGQTYISFSGGKDSLVLLHLCRQVDPNMKAVFFNTGLEFPEINQFIRTIENVEWVKPKMMFKDMLDKYGYPVISKEQASYISDIRNTKSEKTRAKRLSLGSQNQFRLSDKWRFMLNSPFKISAKCCDIFKKQPSKIFEKKSGLSPYIGTMVDDSMLRLNAYLKHGHCNSFIENGASRNISTPLSFWLEKDIWQYIHTYIRSYCSIYDMGYKNTGCVFCLFGLHMQKRPHKFDLLKNTHPKLYEYCMKNLGMEEVIKFYLQNEKQTISENQESEQKLF